MRRICLLTLFIMVSIQGYSQSTKSAQITGGFEVDISERPFQISLQNDGGHFCGGSIINNRWILTAAHCMFDRFGAELEPEDIQIAIGISTQDQVGIEGQLIDVASIIVHPDYDAAANNNDIALLELEDDIIFNENSQPIRIINDDNLDLTEPDFDVFASGWGWTNPGESSASEQLMGVEVFIISNEDADEMLDISSPPHPELTDNMISSGYDGTEREGPCHGDSGGPLTAENHDGINYLIGAVSWGVPSCIGDENSPTVYTNILNYEAWIYDNTCQDDLSIDGEITNDVHLQASNSITISSSISDGVNAIISAGNSISLTSGFSFSAANGGSLEVFIGGDCAMESILKSAAISQNNLSKSNDNIVDNDNIVTVFPNPTSNSINFYIKTNENADYEIEIFNSLGSRIMLKRQSVENELNVDMDLSTYVNGVYYYIVSNSSKIWTGKIIKQ